MRELWELAKFCSIPGGLKAVCPPCGCKQSSTMPFILADGGSTQVQRRQREPVGRHLIVHVVKVLVHKGHGATSSGQGDTTVILEESLLQPC